MREGFKMKIQFYVPGNNFFPCLYAHINTIYTPLYISERFLLRASLYLSANKIAKSTSTYTRSLATTSICIITRLIFDQASALISNCQQNRSAEINSFPTALPPSAPKKKNKRERGGTGNEKICLRLLFPLYTHTHTHTHRHTPYTHTYIGMREESHGAHFIGSYDLSSSLQIIVHVPQWIKAEERQAVTHTLSLSLSCALSRDRDPKYHPCWSMDQ